MDARQVAQCSIAAPQHHPPAQSSFQGNNQVESVDRDRPAAKATRQKRRGSSAALFIGTGSTAHGSTLPLGQGVAVAN
jgi:hypothetical protein